MFSFGFLISAIDDCDDELAITECRGTALAEYSFHGNRSTLTQQSYGAQGKAILYTLYMFMHTASLGENTHREQCRFSNKRFFGKGSTTENRESRHKVHREMHPFEQKEEKKRILIIGSTASDRADASFYPNTARNQSRWIDNRATHLSPTLLSSVHFLFRSAVVN